MPRIPKQEVFKYFDADDPNPIGKYKQPKPNDDATGSGYPVKDVDMDNIMVKGRWPSGTKKKSRMDMKGAGAAQKGKKFYPGD